jgi:hypothetical protein
VETIVDRQGPAIQKILGDLDELKRRKNGPWVDGCKMRGESDEAADRRGTVPACGRWDMEIPYGKGRLG